MKPILDKSTYSAGHNFQIPVKQKDIVKFLIENPCKSETEIQWELFGYSRSNSYYSNKKYADRLREAMWNGMVKRVRMQIKGVDKQKKYRYFVPENVVELIQANPNWFTKVQLKDIKQSIKDLI